MGVDVTTYLVYGIKLTYAEWEAFGKDLYEDFIAEIEGAPERKFDIIDDGMCGEYVVIGKTIASLAEQEDDFQSFKILDFSLSFAIIDNINTALGTSYSHEDFRILFFNHFS